MQSSVIYEHFKQSEEASSFFKEGKFFAVNKHFLALFGLTHAKEVISRSPEDFSPKNQPDGISSAEKIRAMVKQVRLKGHCEFDWLFEKAGGDVFATQVSLTVKEQAGREWVQAIFRPLERFQSFMDKISNFFFEKSTDAMLVAGDNARILAVNDAFTEVTGYSKREAMGRPAGFMKSGQHNASFYRNMWEKIQSLGTWDGEIWDRHKSGHVFPKRLHISAVKNIEGKVTHYLGIFREAQSELDYRDNLKKLAFYDSLTTLPNRRYLMDNLEVRTKSDESGDNTFALMIVDVDNFKEINDKHGHAVGDKVLKLVAQRLQSLVNEQSLLGRLGGDEFLLILQSEQPEIASDALLARIQPMFEQPARIAGKDIQITLSFGISCCPNHAPDASQLMYFADLALYQAKIKKGFASCVFEAQMAALASAKNKLMADMAEGLNRDEFVPYFQPKYDAKTLEITGFEALIRWQHPSEGVLAPGHFIEIAHEANLLTDITKKVLDGTCRLLGAFTKSQGLAVSINVTGEQIIEPGFVNLISRYVNAYKISYAQLELEITENQLVKHISAAQDSLQQLKQLGVKISLDDFGKGYSSLSYLKSLPVDKLKIDKFFVDDICTMGESSRNLVETIIHLGGIYDIKVVAEGVETMSQLEVLRELDCHEIQGYLLSQPVPETRVWETMHLGTRQLDS